MRGPDCPICGNECEPEIHPTADARTVKCIRCGSFDVSGLFVAAMRSEHHEARWRWQLSSAIRAATDETGKLHEQITVENYEKIIAHARRPADPIAQVEWFIAAIAARSTHLGASSDADYYEAWAARVWLPDERAAQRMAAHLHKMGLIEQPFPARDNGGAYELTYKGWSVATELRRKRGSGNQAFVAMWFHPGMDRVYDEALLPALTELGHKPYRVDRDGHGDRIDDKIISEIRRSRLLVAECTGARQSVYYEAGRADGGGLDVIWCCYEPSVLDSSGPLFDAPPPEPGAKPWFEQLSFDTRQYPCLTWASLPQLKTKIVDRVRARGLDLKRKD